jgi:two-component system sensor histidine kinase CpxA
MKARLPLTARIMLLAAANILVLVALTAAFVQFELGREFDSVLLTTARERLLAVGRAFALDLAVTDAAHRSELADRYSSEYGLRISLLSNDGRVLIGDGSAVPADVLTRVREGRGRGGPGFAPEPGRGEPPSFDGTSPGRGVPPIPTTPPFLVTTSGPEKYWVGVRIPVRSPENDQTIPGTLVLASASLLGNPFYFQPMPWVGIIAVVVIVTLLCWLPFIRGMTRSISTMTRATAQIADGRFDVAMPVRRSDELGALAKSIESMSGRLKLLVSGQKRFLGDAAHELRSPLARLTMGLSLLEREATGSQLRRAEDLREDLDMMMKLTDDLLAFARTDFTGRPPTVKAVAVRDVVSRAVKLEAPDAGVQIDVYPGVRVLADPDLLLRALSNLIRNALQYARAAGPIRVEATVEGDQTKIAVADSGPGVPASELENIFAPFYRPETARERRTGGTGLVLAIVRNVAEACGGSVSCRNLQPRGFEVAIRLPTIPTSA